MNIHNKGHPAVNGTRSNYEKHPWVFRDHLGTALMEYGRLKIEH